jgi:hypothetical protein
MRCANGYKKPVLRIAALASAPKVRALSVLSPERRRSRITAKVTPMTTGGNKANARYDRSMRAARND